MLALDPNLVDTSMHLDVGTFEKYFSGAIITICVF